jgi:hypothetical protein
MACLSLVELIELVELVKLPGDLPALCTARVACAGKMEGLDT